MHSHNAAPGSAALTTAEAVSRLLEGVADLDGRGLVLDCEMQPVRRSSLPHGSTLAQAAEGLLRIAAVAEKAAELLRDHPDPSVRRACALLAARAHPLRAGLESEPSPNVFP